MRAIPKFGVFDTMSSSPLLPLPAGLEIATIETMDVSFAAAAKLMRKLHCILLSPQQKDVSEDRIRLFVVGRLLEQLAQAARLASVVASSTKCFSANAFTH